MLVIRRGGRSRSLLNGESIRAKMSLGRRLTSLRRRYYMLVGSEQWGPEIRELCTRILEKTIEDRDKYQIGLTKIFFRAGLLARFEQLRTNRLNELATLMQKNVRRHLAVKNYQTTRRAVIGVQTLWRATLARRRAEEQKRQTAAMLIQRTARGYMERARYLRAQKTIAGLQSSECSLCGKGEHLLIKPRLVLIRSRSRSLCPKHISAAAH